MNKALELMLNFYLKGQTVLYILVTILGKTQVYAVLINSDSSKTDRLSHSELSPVVTS